MEKYNIYQQIAERTQGDIYIGIVGPVRTGKSTFIKRFMDLLVIPNIENAYQKERAKDELPQSATGRTIMTTEPKFVPNEAVEITVDENVRLKVRLVDCVGYLVKGALGYMEDESPRMVSTPWYDHQIPFEEAAELGTKKVITEHSTIGLVVVTDGSITDLDREEYIEAEKRVINELKSINKPFVIILNSTRPSDAETIKLRDELEDKYSVPVINVNCAQLRVEDINSIMENILYEFPIDQMGINIPRWIETLEDEHWLKADIINAIKDTFKGVAKIREAKDAIGMFGEYDFIKRAYIDRINLAEGNILVDLSTSDGLFYRVLSETTGLEIEGEHRLVGMMKDLSRIKREYEKIEYALHEVKIKGYGMVMPQMEELSLEEPEIVKQGARFGIKLRASAPSIHMIRADIETEIAPIVGTEKQSEELVSYLLKEFESDPGKIWESNIFGKSLHELVNEGLQNKLFRMPEDAQLKLQETLQKIINEGSGGLICIIL
ncbi:stage IV sporulation protein A [Anaerobacterium chartisolvens]|uniref:Stage IV sporulation protein A n=1 Tax=Anaerobacterium chartisolvens TaxID=1297424 RepID=A0A369BFN4_9FIRM|nr:stage IV sporulation protein A [Anaerobacterium chartisolvens]RCX20075.1 stage IV sporulation protein A [Anaerobacterium chartisolvens]